MLMRCLLLLAMPLLLPLAATAEPTPDLFTVETLVVNQTTEVRRQAATDGLATVLVRMSGSRGLLNNPGIVAALDEAAAYLYQFSYQSTDQTITLLGAEQPATRLVMRFNPALLEELLSDNQLPLWAASRPEVLVWTGFSDQSRGQASNPLKDYVNNESPLGNALQAAARKRGLPLLFPVLDLEDRAALPVPRLWALDEDMIQVAAVRYQSDGILAGRFRQEQEQWSGNFILLHQGDTTYFTARGNQLSDIAADTMDQVTDYFVGIYGFNPTAVVNDDKTIIVQVNNVSDFGRYIQLLNYLENLALVAAASPGYVDDPIIQVEVGLNAELERFLSVLTLDKKLARVSENELIDSGFGAADSRDLSVGLRYQLRVLEFLWVE